MGKDLKGRELGVGISQRKDGLYTGRFTDKFGKRKQRYFEKLQECRQWIADARFNDEHNNIEATSDMTLSAWFDYWITEIKGNNIRSLSQKTYKSIFNIRIKPTMGNMLLSDIKPIHCQNVLNLMSKNYKNSAICMTRTLMCSMFNSAVENDLILKNPITKGVKCYSGKASTERRVLTLDEQKLFLESVKNTQKYNAYAFVLQTGLRCGELNGLQWSDIDFQKRIMHIKRNMEYDFATKKWYSGPPKTNSGLRSIPLTKEAISILQNQQEKNKKIKIIPLEYSDFVFLANNGKLSSNSVFDNNISYHCAKNGIKKFSMHSLRHTFATRCIEAGMKPKTLQIILGHSDISMTMNTYVHTTSEEKRKEVEAIEANLKLV